MDHSLSLHTVHATGQWAAFDTFCDICFILDIFLNFRTTYRVDGEVIADPPRISARYMRGWLFPDVVASIPLSIIMHITHVAQRSSGYAGEVLKLARLAKILKLFRVLKMDRIMRRIGTVFRIGVGVWNPGVTRLGGTVLKLCGCWHMIACSYWYLATID